LLDIALHNLLDLRSSVDIFPLSVRSIPLAMTGFSLAAASWNSSSRVDRNTELLSFFRLLNSAAIERELRSRVQMAPDFCARQKRAFVTQ